MFEHEDIPKNLSREWVLQRRNEENRDWESMVTPLIPEAVDGIINAFTITDGMYPIGEKPVDVEDAWIGQEIRDQLKRAHIPWDCIYPLLLKELDARGFTEEHITWDENEMFSVHLDPVPDEDEEDTSSQ